MNLTQGILMAIVHKERTGEGQQLLTSQTGAMIQFQGSELSRYTATGDQKDEGFDYRRVHQAQMQHCGNDGKWFMVSVMLDKQWAALCNTVSRPDLINDKRSVDMKAKRENKHWLKAELAEAFRAKPRDEWIALLNAAKVPVGPCNDYADVAKEEQLWANGYLQKVQHPTHGEVTVFGKPLSFSASPAAGVSYAPELGEHTEEMLKGELGFSEQEVQQLAEKGAVSIPEAEEVRGGGRSRL